MVRCEDECVGNNGKMMVRVMVRVVWVEVYKVHNQM